MFCFLFLFISFEIYDGMECNIRRLYSKTNEENARKDNY